MKNGQEIIQKASPMVHFEFTENSIDEEIINDMSSGMITLDMLPHL